jgi:xanthine dehydrogenase accessory factor
MQKDILQKVLLLKKDKKEFAIVTDLQTSLNYIYQPGEILLDTIQLEQSKIEHAFHTRTNGMLEGTQLFVENYHRPIQVVIVGAVHIAQYFCEYAKHLNFEITIIDPRGYFASAKRFPDIKIINEWPNDAFAKIKIDHNTALIALTHDPKIDDPAIQHALNVKCFYIGALGSKKTHENRCDRLEKAGFSREMTKQIHGPIGIKLGGRSAPEIALSVVSQLVSEVYKRK